MASVAHAQPRLIISCWPFRAKRVQPLPNRTGYTTSLDAVSAARCDVLVVGSGPAGSTIAALLAERGRRVVIVEKDRHPRFHIGESPLPLNLPLFQRLGVKEQIESIGMIKYGVEVVSPYHRKGVTR